MVLIVHLDKSILHSQKRKKEKKEEEDKSILFVEYKNILISFFF